MTITPEGQGGSGLPPARAAIGRWIRRRRELLGISQQGLRRRLEAAGVSVSQSTLSRWEQGELAPPGDVLADLARALGSSLDTLEEVLARARRPRVDLTGHTVEELVRAGDDAARAGHLHRAVERYEAALDLAELRDDRDLSPEQRGLLLLKLTWTYRHLWELEAARRTLRRFSALSDLPSDLAFRGLVQHLLLEQRYGDRAAADAFGELILQRIEKASLPERAFGVHSVGSWYYQQGRFVDASPLFRRAVDLWQELGNLREEARARAALAYCLSRAGQPDEGRAEALRAIEQARRERALDVEGVAQRMLGRILGEAGGTAEALERLENAAGLARRAGLDADEFVSLWHAWRFATGKQRERYARQLRRLLRRVNPRLPEAREFVAAGLAGDEEEDER